jgi:hypothetical protein
MTIVLSVLLVLSVGVIALLARSRPRRGGNTAQRAVTERDRAQRDRAEALARLTESTRQADTARTDADGARAAVNEARAAADRARAQENGARAEAARAREEADLARAEAARLLAEAQDLRARTAQAQQTARHEAEAARRAREEAEESRREAEESRKVAEESRKAFEPMDDDPDWVQSELDEMRRLAADGGALPPLAEADQPTSGIPQQLPLSPDATTDSVLDGADLGALVVRAASVCGDGHRRRQQHRRDAVLLRLPVGMGQPTLLSATAAGVPDGAWSQSAAAHACRALLAQVQNHAAVLGPWLHEDAVADMPGPVAALRLALNDVGQAIRVEAKGRGWVSDQGKPDDRAVGVALTGLLSPLGDRGARTHLAFGVGDGLVLRLRGRTWSQVFPVDEPGFDAAELLPVRGAPVRWAAVDTREGDLLAVCTRPTARLLLHEVTGSWFAERWTAGQPRLTSFLLQVNARIRAAVEDRTLVCVWDHGYATEAARARFAAGGPR